MTHESPAFAKGLHHVMFLSLRYITSVGVAAVSLGLAACGHGGSSYNPAEHPPPTPYLSFQCQFVVGTAYNSARVYITNEGSDAVTNPAYILVIGYSNGGQNTFSEQYNGTIAAGQTGVTSVGVAATDSESCVAHQ